VLPPRVTAGSESVTPPVHDSSAGGPAAGVTRASDASAPDAPPTAARALAPTSSASAGPPTVPARIGVAPVERVMPSQGQTSPAVVPAPAPPGGSAAIGSPTERPLRAHRWWIAAATTVVLVGAGVGAYVATAGGSAKHRRLVLSVTTVSSANRSIGTRAAMRGSAPATAGAPTSTAGASRSAASTPTAASTETATTGTTSVASTATSSSSSSTNLAATGAAAVGSPAGDALQHYWTLVNTGQYAQAFAMETGREQAQESSFVSDKVAAQPMINVVSIGHPSATSGTADVAIRFYARDSHPSPNSDTICRLFAVTAEMTQNGSGSWLYDGPVPGSTTVTEVPGNSNCHS